MTARLAAPEVDRAEFIPHRPPAARVGRFALWGLLFVVVTGAQLLRQSGLSPWETIWAEDGGIFYTGTPDITHLFDGYAGYLEIVPRVLGLGAQVVPVHHLDAYFALAGAVVTTLCAGAVWYFSSEYVPVAILRTALALSVVLLPALLLEQLGNGVNSIWALTFAAWWAILYRPSRTRDAVLPAIVVMLAVMSQAIVLAYAPVVAYLAWRRRDRPTFLVGGLFLVGSLAQLAVVAGAEAGTQVGPNSLGDLPQLYAVRVLGSALVGENAVGDLWDTWGVWFAVLATVVVVGVVIVLAQWAARERRAVGLLCLGYALGLWVLCVWGRGSLLLRIADTGYSSIGTRWSSLSIWFLLSGLFVLAATVRVRSLRNLAVTVLVLQFAVVAFCGFRGTNARSEPPTWDDSIRAVQGVCATGAQDRVPAFVSPPDPRFSVVITCDEVR